MILEYPHDLIDVIIFVLFHLRPKRFADITVPCVFCIVVLDAPEAFIFLNELRHEIVNVVIEHTEAC